MTVASIEAHCRQCGATFTLRDLLLEQSGRCPACGILLAPDWTPVLLEAASRAEMAQARLVEGLRRLVGLPGFVEILPGVIIRNLFEEVDWEPDLSADPDAVEHELQAMRQELNLWAKTTVDPDNRKRPRRLRRLVRRVRRATAPETWLDEEMRR